MAADEDEVLGNNAQGRLRSFVERIERLDEDRKAIMEDIKEVFAEAKGEGFDTKILRKAFKISQMDKAKRAEEEAVLALYLAALGLE